MVQSEGFLVDEVRNKLIIPHHEMLIEPDDGVIMLNMRKRQATEVLRLPLPDG